MSPLSEKRKNSRKNIMVPKQAVQSPINKHRRMVSINFGEVEEFKED